MNKDKIQRNTGGITIQEVSVYERNIKLRKGKKRTKEKRRRIKVVTDVKDT
jgi:hypothetical protein